MYVKSREIRTRSFSIAVRLVPFYVAYAGCGMVVHYVISLMQERLFLRRRI